MTTEANATMTPAEIAAHLLAQATFTDETMAPMLAYRRAKRATGAPVGHENAIVEAAHRCDEARRELREHLVRAAKEATNSLARLDAVGARMDGHPWCYLGNETADGLNRAMLAKWNRLRAFLSLWVEVADRIVATDEDRARLAAQARRIAVAHLAERPIAELRALAKRHGVKSSGSRDELAEALVAAGVTP